ncbi:amidase family protein [Compostimonas suwonensis]|uniref:Amidase n=1 Tax=Compostimonas suwonensis TaxID=1048394 RepID=A0A2M9BCA0_9MICO|nr:amidase family protein [Compostimonas suwonensis]PJJ55567.1 amidase [Compostimonas suwonensis]
MSRTPTTFSRTGRTLGLALCLTVGAVALPLGASPALAGVPYDAPPVVDLGISDIDGLLASGQTTSVELVKQYLARIAAYEDAYGDQPGINAIITQNENALAEAAALDAERAAGHVRGPLHGVPIVVKDNYDTGDMPTSNGSVALKDFRPADDATQVERLRAAGAIIVAKTNLHEYASGITTISSLGGQTRNPYDQTRNPGGSSGGTGAGVSSSFAAAGMGSDTCGSIRIPAAQNNLVGLRPTLGLSSRDGIAPMSATQDVGGPIAKSVTDIALMLDATVGYDPKDPITALSDGQIPDSYTTSLTDAGLQGRTIGLVVNYLGTSEAEQPTTELIRAAVDDLEAQGATVVEITFPDELNAAVSGAGVINDEFKRDLNAYLAQDGASYPAELAALTAPAETLTLSDIVASGLVTPSVLSSLATRDAMPDLPNPAYDAKIANRALAGALVTQIFGDNDLDALAYPTIKQVAVPVEESQPGSNCSLSANTGFPALSVQAGFTPAGMPVGLELLGLPFTEPTLLAMGYDFEQATGHRSAPTSVPELAADPAPTPEPTTDPDTGLVTTPADSSPRLPATGADPLPTVLTSGGILALGLGAVLAAGLIRRRRSDLR